ncbi:twin arginine-targeting protein translocase TatB, partial [Nesterenkonia sp. F]|uniref:twin arginine-targeting protein translocase TatB n=1 Tax=Nesterenkonia sp. F TaxID=795955 RepID=UPI000255C7D9
MPGLNGYEFIILGVLAVVLLGPERLPVYAQTLARWVRQARSKAEDAKEYFREETGTDFDEVDWKRYDPRQYDPRRIIREALAEDYEETRRAVNEVRDSARLTTGRRGTAAGAARGSGGTRSASGSGSSEAAAGGSTGSGAAASGGAASSGAD